METIAERDMILVQPSGEKDRFTIRFGKPYRMNAHEWACPVVAPALCIGNHDIRGRDSFQALMLAEYFLHFIMRMRMKEGVSFLNPEDDSVLDVTSFFGLTA